MKEVKFTGKINFMEYHSHRVSFRHGEVKSIPDDLADYLLSDFPEYFTEVKPKPKKKEISRPPKDKMFRKHSAKTK